MTKSIAKELGDQVELGFRLCEDRPKGKFALKCDRVGQNGFMGGFVDQNVGWLIVFGDTDGRMPRELRITFLPVSNADVEGGGSLGFVVDRQPNRWLVIGRPLDSMLGMCGQVDVITRTEIDGSIFELQPSCPLQDHYPLMIILVVPEPLWRCMTIGNDPFNANAIGLNQSLYEFFWEV